MVSHLCMFTPFSSNNLTNSTRSLTRASSIAWSRVPSWMHSIMKKKKKIPHRPRSVAWQLISFTALWVGESEAGTVILPARRQSPTAVLSPIKLAYSPGRPDGRLKLTARAFNRLGQYTSSPGHRGYCCAELAVSSQAMGVTTTSSHFTIPQRVEGWVDLAGRPSRCEACQLGRYQQAVTHRGANRAWRRVTLFHPKRII